MQAQPVVRLFRGVFRLILLLTTLLTAFVVKSYVIVKIVQHNKKLRPILLKPYNKIIVPIAGRRFSPYALLEHTGRRSGRAYATPVGAFPFEDGFVVGLSYGADVDWCRNIMASGHAVVKWRGQEFALERPELIPMSAAVLQALPAYFRLPARELKQLVWLHRPSPVAVRVQPENDSSRAS
ncbi:MAG: nitroreductase family deazaflavin-dependent oxidoreductase [Mycobacterium sp.]|nr:nitroreductase family deazaflavin-dependent oxidoreductase [Mycobacterium sp.]